MGRIIYNDAPRDWGITFQDNGSLIGEGITKLHNRIMIYIILILIVVIWITTVTIIRFKKNKIIEKYSNHSVTIEIIWTIIPTIIIIGILGPSFSLLYLMDEIIEPVITIKYIGFIKKWPKIYKNKKKSEKNKLNL